MDPEEIKSRAEAVLADVKENYTPENFRQGFKLAVENILTARNSGQAVANRN